MKNFIRIPVFAASEATNIRIDAGDRIALADLDIIEVGVNVNNISLISPHVDDDQYYTSLRVFGMVDTELIVPLNINAFYAKYQDVL